MRAFRTNGDNYWLGVLLPRYTALLLGVALKYLKDRNRAEDAVQQVFVKVLTHLPKEEINNFKGWLYVLMRNHCLQQLRDATYVSGDEVLMNQADEGTDRDELLGRESTLLHLEDAIELLSAEQREVITLFYLKKNSYEQIISCTGYTFMQVKSYLQNGKRNLKTILLNKLNATGR